MSERKRERHTSRPIRRSTFGIISRTNVPYDAPLTPGLRRQVNTQAIGFTADVIHIEIEPPALRDSIKWK